MMPFLKVPTEIARIILLPLGMSTEASAQACKSCSAPPGTLAVEPHSASCQMTPASRPTISLNQATKGVFGNCASRLETGACCTMDIACFSNDSDWAATLIHTHNAITEMFII